MSRKKASTPAEIPPIVPVPVIAFQGNCDQCRHWNPNNKLKGYWEGLCAKGHGMTRDNASCEQWEQKNG